MTTSSPRVFHQLHLAHATLFRAVDKHLKKTEGITTAHQVILFVLFYEDGLPSAEVAKRAGHSKSRLTGLVDTLETKGLLARKTSETDGRVQTLHISRAGRALITRTKKLVQDLNEEMLAPFDESERQTIAVFLERVRAQAGRITKN